MELFFRKVQKTVILALFLAHLAKIGRNENFYKKSAVLFFTLIVPQLHAELQRNHWRGFRDQFVAYIHPYPHKGDITEPVAFAGSTSALY